MTSKHISLLLSLGLLTASTQAITKTLPIMAVQGTTEQSPLANTQSKRVTVSGVITAVQQKALGKDVSRGFYLQDAIGDNNPLTSDGIFVSSKATKVQVGDRVIVSGIVEEKYGMTQLNSKSISYLGHSTKITPTALVPISSDNNFAATLERYEGMLVTITPESKLVVSRNFGYDRKARRNNMALAHERINYQANQMNWPASQGAKKQQQANLTRNLTVESLNKAAPGVIPWYPNFGSTSTDYIRLADSVVGLTGVIGYSYGEYRLYVTNQITQKNIVHHNPRTATPSLIKGDISVATFNVLNYFNSPFGGGDNPTKKSRGARSHKAFELQATKIAKAIVALDADIIGLMEIENNGYDDKSALVDLVSRINRHLNEDLHYHIAQLPNQQFIGTGAITNQVIYRPKTVTLAETTLIKMPMQRAPAVGKESGKNFMRDAITPTFKINGTDEKLTVSVNHFKSKGSTCWEDVAQQEYQDNDIQGSCEQFRVSGALHLGNELAKIDGHRLIIGDLNSYAQEDPLLILTHRNHVPVSYKIDAARDTFIGETPLHGKNGAIVNKSFGYINTVLAKHPQAFGYSFKNIVGTLDYILASPSLKEHIVDAVEWNINSPESTLFEYPSKYTGQMKKYAGPYRSSDHDPVIISLSFK